MSKHKEKQAKLGNSFPQENYYTVELYEKSHLHFDEESGEFSFHCRASNSLSFHSIKDAHTVAKLTHNTHYKIYYHTRSAFGEVVFATEELKKHEEEEAKLHNAMKLNRQIRADLMEKLTSRNEVVWKSVQRCGYQLVLNLNFKTWYNERMSRKLSYSCKPEIDVVYKSGETSTTFVFDPREYFDRSRRFQKKKLREELEWRLREVQQVDVVGCELLINEYVYAVKDWIIPAIKKYSIPFNNMTSHWFEVTEDGETWNPVLEMNLSLEAAMEEMADPVYKRVDLLGLNQEVVVDDKTYRLGSYASHF